MDSGYDIKLELEEEDMGRNSGGDFGVGSQINFDPNIKQEQIEADFEGKGQQRGSKGEEGEAEKQQRRGGGSREAAKERRGSRENRCLNKK